MANRHWTAMPTGLNMAARFVPAFAVIFLVSLLLYMLGQWDQAAH
jgi:hypothetical protein